MLTRPDQGYAIALHRDIDAAAGAWSAMEGSGWLTPYQRLGWADAWLRTIGGHLGVDPLIAEIRRGDEAVAIVPLGLTRRTGCRTAIFLGDRHNNYNMPLLAAADAGPTVGEWRSLLGRIAADARIDAYEFANQPLSWRCSPNPLAEIDSTPTPSPSYAMRLSDDFEALAREKRSARALQQLRRKARKLEERLGEIRFATASRPDEHERVIAAMESHRRDRAASAGVPSFFDTPGATRFVAVAAASGAMRFDYLTAGDTVVAAYAGVVHDGRYSCFLNSFLARDGLDAVSPGEQMLLHLVEQACREGLTYFDLGIGTERYKTAWCEAEPLVEASIAYSAIGQVRGLARRSVTGAKRRIKNTPALWSLWKRVRPRAHGQAEAPAREAD
jgi:CelD/BcsL family acetyltransferase involved in cellulose biosynthesis